MAREDEHRHRRRPGVAHGAQASHGLGLRRDDDEDAADAEEASKIVEKPAGRPTLESGAFLSLRSFDPRMTRELFQLAWPIAAAMLGETAIGLVDTKLVGGLGAGALGGVGLGATLMFLGYA